MKKLPLPKTKEVVVQNLDTEVLVYDLQIDKAYSLNQTSSIVFKACDGKTSWRELKTKHGLTDDLIFLSLDQLKKENLLENGSEYVSPFTGLSRREVIKKVGLTSMIALPVISSLIAPSAVAGASCIATGNTFIISPLPPGDPLRICNTQASRCCGGRIASATADSPQNFLTCECGDPVNPPPA